MTTDSQLLDLLRGADNGSISGKELAQRLKISRASVSSRMQEFRALGYEIVSSPHDGYRLVNAPDTLHADDLISRVGKVQVIGRDIRVFRETGSTNDIVDKLARDGVKEGVVVFAESQTKGRGRLGRKWISPAKKGLWFSTLLRPAIAPQAGTRLNIMSATAVTRAIVAETGLKPEIKWPNDILLGGKKAAGILTELSAELDKVNYLVLGIGLDVNLTASEFPSDLRKIATSLKVESGQSHSRPSLAARILRELDSDYTRMCDGRFQEVADEWEARCTTLGKDVGIRMGPHLIRGRAEALDSDGALMVRTQHGHLEHIVGGDVTLEK